MNKVHYKMLAIATLFSSMAFLSGCHSDNDNNDNNGNGASAADSTSDSTSDSATSGDNKRAYAVRVTNLTANQPFSPVGLVLNANGFDAWSDGQAASVALEHMAEGGDASVLVAEAVALSSNLGTVIGSQPIGPGASGQLDLSVDAAADVKLTLFSMLVNTNDAFTGTNSVSLSDLAVGKTLVLNLPAYDAGTEANTESSGTMPGPADGGEGFNAARGDLLDRVTIHQGVISQDDGLASSVLNQSHRFDNPVARVTITRTE